MMPKKPTGDSSKESPKPKNVHQIGTEKAEMELLRSALMEKLKNKDTAQKAALIISEMINKSA